MRRVPYRFVSPALFPVLLLLAAPALAGDGGEDCYNDPDHLQVSAAELPDALTVTDAELAAVLAAIAAHEGRTVSLAAAGPAPGPRERAPSD